MEIEDIIAHLSKIHIILPFNFENKWKKKKVYFFLSGLKHSSKYNQFYSEFPFSVDFIFQEFIILNSFTYRIAVFMIPLYLHSFPFCSFFLQFP